MKSRKKEERIGESRSKKRTKQGDMFSLAVVLVSLSIFVAFESFILTFKKEGE